MNDQQLSFFDNDDDLPTESIDFGSTEDTEQDKPPERPELLTIRLFKEAIKKENEGDRLLEKFADHVLPNLIRQLVGFTAKGGQFTENRKAEGKNVERSKHDQSLTAHLLNGLFPTYRILKKLKNDPETNQVKRLCVGNDFIEALFICDYILHDSDKLPDYQSWLIANDTDGNFSDRHWKSKPAKKEDAPNFGRDFVEKKVLDFGLDKLFDSNWRDYLDDIVWGIHNAGVKYDADLGMEKRGLNPQLDGRERGILSRLVRISDLFASVIKHPQDIQSSGLQELLHDLSNGQLKFTYHSLSDNRGVLTNILNNALIDAHPKDDYTPLLFLPDGVVYLAKSTACNVNLNVIPDRVVQKISDLCKQQIIDRVIGFDRDDMKRRLKTAPYLGLFFTPKEIICNLLPRAAKKFSQNLEKLGTALKEKQAKKQAPVNVDFDSLIFDGKVDRLGKLLAFVASSISLNNINELIVENIKLQQYIDDLKEFTDSGGTIYKWFYIASRYYETRQEISPDQEIDLLIQVASSLAEFFNQYLLIKDKDVWADLKQYVATSIYLSDQNQNLLSKSESILLELERYKKAKASRGRENVCSLSSSPYTIEEQLESAILFSPNPYSNKQPLSSNPKRHICAVWSIEIMLRQIFMNHTGVNAGDFEDRKYRYLYLYPTYFFTPETSSFLSRVYGQVTQLKFDEVKKKIVINDKTHFSIGDYQAIDSLLLPEVPRDKDPILKMNYPKDSPMTFFFMGIESPRNKKGKTTDTASWVMPAWLAFTLPLVFDVKVVVSESSVPPFISGAEFEETVVLDAAHQAISSFVNLDRRGANKDKFRLDGILPVNSKSKFSPLNALSAAYYIHLETNRKSDGDPNWGELIALARDLETSSLYVFHYLAKQHRDFISIEKIRLYFDFYNYLDPKGEAVNQLRKLTQLYRTFYRAKSQYAKANAVLKPIDEAADVIIKINTALANDTESLTDIVSARLAKLMTNVRRRAAEGKPTLAFVDGKWTPALNSEQERQAIYEFSLFFVKEIFEGTFKGDRSRLAGTQLNLIRDTCDYLYRLEDDRERQERKVEEPTEIPEILEEDNDQSNL